MSSHERDRDGDHVEALRDAFAGMPVPEATPTLDDSDAATRAAVGWMAQAFAALPVPEVAVPEVAAPGSWRARPHRREAPVLRHGARRRPAGVPAAPWVRQAAAAAIFATLGLALWWSRGSEPPVRAPLAPLPVLTQESTPTSPPAIPGFREAAPGPAGLVAVTTDHLEVSSGPVRLVLLTTGPLARGPQLDLP